MMKLYSKLIVVSLIALAISVNNADAQEQTKMVSADACPKSMDWQYFIEHVPSKIETDKPYQELYFSRSMTLQISNNSYNIIQEILKLAREKNLRVKEIRFVSIQRDRCAYEAVDGNNNIIGASGFGMSVKHQTSSTYGVSPSATIGK